MVRAEGKPVVCAALINNEDWPGGRELLQRFVLPGIKPLELRQYLFLRRTGKRAAPRPGAVVAPSAAAPTAAAKKPWWKVW